MFPSMLALQLHFSENFLHIFDTHFPFDIEQLLRPIYKQIAENQNAEIFSANTLLVIFGTSLLTARVCILFVYIYNLCSAYNYFKYCTLTGWAIDGTWSFFGWFVISRNRVLLAGRVRYSSIPWASVRAFLYDGEFFNIVASNVLFCDVDVLHMFCCKYI
jgi:hypothetical protein